MSTWAVAAHRVDGTPTVIDGIDVWTFDDGRIAIKDAYRKSFSDHAI